MGYRNKFIAVLLMWAIFINGELAEGCFCGKSCFHITPVKSIIPFHARCSSNHCKSCDLEKGKTLKAAKPLTSLFHFKVLDAKSISLRRSEELFTHHTLTPLLLPICFRLTISSSPIYLQNLSIRC